MLTMTLETIASKTVAANPQAADNYINDDRDAINYLVDEVMRECHGTHDTLTVRRAIQHQINKRR